MISRMIEKIFPVRNTKILLIGLDAAGKTTALYRLKLKKPVRDTMPTIGLNVETIVVKNLSLTIWDVGAHSSSLRKVWERFNDNTDAVIFMVDSADEARF